MAGGNIKLLEGLNGNKKMSLLRYRDKRICGSLPKVQSEASS
jgi:hypothetical protein